MTPSILCLGRNGDVINSLAIARRLSREHNQRVKFLIGSEFAPLLEGCSYVEPVVYPVGPERLPDILQHARTNHPGLIVSQVFKHPQFSQETASFARESWRLAGCLDAFGTELPLFDQRDYAREERLLSSVKLTRPAILFAGDGISSPFPHSAALLALLRERFPRHCVIDMSSVKAERLYDLGALYEQADLLVSVDTVHLWLARAFPIPTIAITNDGWRGSPPPPCAVAAFRYGQMRSLEAVAAACKAALLPSERSILVIDAFGDQERHHEARATWKPDVLIARSDWSSDGPPLLNQLLEHALLRAESGRDVIVWTNDDVQLSASAFALLKTHCAQYGVVTVRRHDGHIGRELFAATADWLRDHLHALPKMRLSLPWFDLALACYVRASKGIRSTMENLMCDMEPCEIAGEGILHHPHHPSGWLDKQESVGEKENRAEFERFFNQPV